MIKYFKTVIIAMMALLAFTINSTAAPEQLRISGDWMVDFSTMETFYSGISNNQELTMECYNGEFKFGYFNKTTSDEENSNDMDVTIYIDGIPFPYPMDGDHKKNFYTALQNAKHTIQYTFSNGVESTNINVTGLATLLSQIPFDESNCE